MPDNEHPVQVAEEVLTVDKRSVLTGRVRIETRTETLNENAEADLESDEIEVVRIPIGRQVDVAPAVRTEGEVTIFPVMEEQIVLQRRLVLREEVHVRKRRTVQSVQVPVALRRQNVLISREAPVAPEGNTIMTDSTGTYDDRTLTALFDSREKAEAAQRRLLDLGLSDASLRLTGGDDYVGRKDYQEDRGFWDSLHDFFFPSEDSAVYAEGLRRGGYLLTVRGVPTDQHDEVIDILDDDGSVDLDERASSWSAEGWSGASSAAPEPGTGAAAAGAMAGIGAGAAVGATASSFAPAGLSEGAR